MEQRGERHVGRMANIVEKTVPHVEAMEPGAILDRIDDVETLDKIGRRAFGIADGQQDLTQWAVNIAILKRLTPRGTFLASGSSKSAEPNAIICNQPMQSDPGTGRRVPWLFDEYLANKRSFRAFSCGFLRITQIANSHR
jgi:hypothetical protein